MSRMIRMLVATVVMSTLVAASPAAAARVAWTLPRDTGAGQPLEFSWKASGLKTTDRLVVQRRAGTWRDEKRLGRARSGSGVLRARPLGSHRFRLIVRTIRGRVAAQSLKTVRAYGPVPLGVRRPGILDTPDGAFGYSDWGTASTTETTTLVRVTRSYCRAVYLAFVASDVPGGDPGRASQNHAIVSVVQDGRQPTSAVAMYGVQGALDAPLVVGRAWSVTLRAEGPSTSPMGVYVNGVGNCFKRTAIVGDRR